LVNGKGSYFAFSEADGRVEQRGVEIRAIYPLEDIDTPKTLWNQSGPYWLVF
jgi:hypothetical protein